MTQDDLIDSLDASAPPGTEEESNEQVTRCDYCRLPIPNTPIPGTGPQAEYRYCTEACRDEQQRFQRVFSTYHGFRRVSVRITALDRFLPEGMPRNSFVLLSGEAGSRMDALGVELIWRTLRRDEPAVIVTFTEPPVSVIQRFLDLDWNVFPALAEDRFRIVDCFTARIDDPDRFERRLNDWNRHLNRLVGPQTTVVGDPSDPAEIRNKLDNELETLEMVDTGTVYVDSLTEFGSLVQPVQAYDFLKDLRADVCKARFVPLFAGATVINDHDEYPHDAGYAMDGIIDLELSDTVIQNTLIRRIRVRKMNGVLVISEWTAYEFTGGQGLVAFDPLEQLADTDEKDTDTS